MSESVDGGNGADEYDAYDYLDFPCRFEIKVMGRQSNRFSALVQSIVGRHILDTDMISSNTRPSRKGKYISITCIINAQNKHQIRCIYADLSSCPDVLMVL